MFVFWNSIFFKIFILDGLLEYKLGCRSAQLTQGALYFGKHFFTEIEVLFLTRSTRFKLYSSVKAFLKLAESIPTSS